LSRIVRICIQSLEKMLIRAKQIFLQKFNMSIKKCKISVRSFSTFTHVCQTCFAYNFFGAFFKTLDLKSAEILGFDTFFDIKKNF
jgi:hypothetical protein